MRSGAINIPKREYDLLKLLDGKEALTRNQIQGLLDQEGITSYTAKMIVPLMRKRLLIEPGSVGSHLNMSYVISKLGREVLNKPENFNIFGEVRPNQYSKPGQPAKSKKPSPAEIEPAPLQPELDLSHDANLMVDQISRVAHQNAAYREAMLKTAQTLAGYLGMELVKKQPKTPPQPTE